MEEGIYTQVSPQLFYYKIFRRLVYKMDEFCGFDQILHCVKIIVEVMVVSKFVRDFLCNCDHEFKQMIEASVFT
jgi:hypothetical protein